MPSAPFSLVISPLKAHKSADRGPRRAFNSLLDLPLWLHKGTASHTSRISALMPLPIGRAYPTNQAPEGSCPLCSNNFQERRLFKDPWQPFWWLTICVGHSPNPFCYWKIVSGLVIREREHYLCKPILLFPSLKHPCLGKGLLNCW